MDMNIMAQVYQYDLIGADLLCSGPSSKQAVSAKHEVLGQAWLVPVVKEGVFNGDYQRLYQVAAPTTDSISVVMLRNPDTGASLNILGTLTDWVNKANACCGTTQEMPDVNIPDLVLEEFPCPPRVCTVAADAFLYSDSAPVLAAGEAIVPSGTQLGVAFSPAYSGVGFLTVGSALTWIQANWGAYGTFALTPGGAGIQLTTTAKSGSFALKIKRAGSIATLGSITGGSGGTNGTYNGVALTGGHGTGATANITVASNAVSAVTIVSRGVGYQAADVLSAASSAIGSTTGFSVPVATVQVGA